MKMNEESLISIIIPVYNGSKYIVKCLESILVQTLQKFEIIIINDGSNDNSLEIIEAKLSNKLEKERYMIISQENKGQGEARNKGMKYAKGDYITFIDQDDYIDINYLEGFWGILNEGKPDVVISGYKRVDENGKIKKRVYLCQSEWSKFTNITPWGKMYKRKFIKEHNIKFLPVLLGEDVYFSIQVYSNAGKIKMLERSGYNWLDNKKSLSNTVYREQKKADIFPVLNSLIALPNASKWKENKYYEYFILKTAIWYILYTARSGTKENNKKLATSIYLWLKEKFPNYLKNPYIGLFRLKGEKIYLRIIILIYVTMIYTKADNILFFVVSKKE